MSTFTENYDLIKPDLQDFYDVADFNENMDTIDTALSETAVINEKIGEFTDTGSETVFGKLNSGGSVIKQIQSFEVKHKTDGANETVVDIKPVNPEKCVVLMERIQDSSVLKSTVRYVLTENTLTVKNTSSVTGTVTVQVQIIEFN